MSANADGITISEEERMLAKIFGETPEQFVENMEKRREAQLTATKEAFGMVKEQSKKTEFSLEECIGFQAKEIRDAVRAFTKKQTIGNARRVVTTQCVMHFLNQYNKTFKNDYDVLEAEHRIMRLLHVITFSQVHAFPEPIIQKMKDKISYGNPDLLEKVLAEIDQVANNTKEFCGWQINHISSGKTIYEVVTYQPSEQEGISEEMVTVGEYNSREEAETACGEDEDIFDYDPNELFAIMPPEGEPSPDMYHPFRERAIVFLLMRIEDKTPWWQIYEKMADQYELYKKTL